ncbi:hypothetical protein CYMTET_34599, partial [Cymbomonas tetramitiformis]
QAPEISVAALPSSTHAVEAPVIEQHPVPFVNVPQPPIPNLSVAAPFTEAALQAALPDIQAFTRILLQHYTTQQGGTSRSAVTWPAAIILCHVEDSDSGALTPTLCEIEAPITELTQSCKWAVEVRPFEQDGKPGGTVVWMPLWKEHG